MTTASSHPPPPPPPHRTSTPTLHQLRSFDSKLELISQVIAEHSTPYLGEECSRIVASEVSDHLRKKYTVDRTPTAEEMDGMLKKLDDAIMGIDEGLRELNDGMRGMLRKPDDGEGGDDAEGELSGIFGLLGLS